MASEQYLLWSNIASILNGNLDPVFEALKNSSSN